VPAHIFAPGPGFKRLDIAIDGAGIAGLGAAIGLCQSGHRVEVHSLNMYQVSATYKGNMD
jgi:ribulose 1,5-bisphosphate synthetase/thiazole synthase